MNIKHRKSKATQITIIGIVGNVLLTVLKFIAGYIGLSSAMIADAIHSLSDLITDAIVLIGIHLACKPADKEHPYGHARIETFATIVISIVLLFAGFCIFYNGLRKIFDFYNGIELVSPTCIALVMAIVSIIVKELLFIFTKKVGEKINSDSLISNAWHHRSDALSSIATLLGVSGAIFLGKKFRILDPIAAMIVSVFILIIAIKILKNSFSELMDKSLPENEIENIKQICGKIKGIKNPHSIKTRKIGFRLAIDLHVYIDKNTSFIKVHNITEKLENAIKAYYGNGTFICIHPEPK